MERTHKNFTTWTGRFEADESAVTATCGITTGDCFNSIIVIWQRMKKEEISRATGSAFV